MLRRTNKEVVVRMPKRFSMNDVIQLVFVFFCFGQEKREITLKNEI